MGVIVRSTANSLAMLEGRGGVEGSQVDISKGSRRDRKVGRTFVQLSRGSSRARLRGSDT